MKRKEMKRLVKAYERKNELLESILQLRFIVSLTTGETLINVTVWQAYVQTLFSDSSLYEDFLINGLIIRFQ